MVNCLCVSQCGKAFASNRKLCYHQNRCKTCQHTAKYRCGKCSKMFSTPRQLKEHQVAHSDVRKFRCHICDKSFKRKWNYILHMKSVHSDVKNFQCHVCGRRFNRDSSCNRHVETHFGIKNFKCTVCDRSFLRYEHARRHEENCRQNNVCGSDSSSDDDDGELDLADNGLTDGDVKMDFNGCGEDTD